MVRQGVDKVFPALLTESFPVGLTYRPAAGAMLVRSRAESWARRSGFMRMRGMMHGAARLAKPEAAAG